MGSLRVNNLGKSYKRYRNKWSRLAEWLSLGRIKLHERRWVFRGVTFEIRPGEAVAIIGKNGAGKSTLLKLITGTTLPTEGDIEIGGRVAALLELGIGFQQDFTGRENIRMTGQLLGFTTGEIEQAMSDIEAFAEIGTYIDQPVRTYSSGMQVRLAFSLATAIRPDMLIVDEALSVGDAYFQHKSFSRIRQFKKQGTTLLFVSHDAAAIRTLCDRAFLIEGGQLVIEGSPDAVLDYYNALIVNQERTHLIDQSKNKHGQVTTRSGSGEATIISAAIYHPDGSSTSSFQVGQEVKVEVKFRSRGSIPGLTVGVLVKDRLGNEAFGTNTYYHGKVIHNISVGDVCRVIFCLGLNLGPGTYSLSAALVRVESNILVDNFEWIDSLLIFEVVNSHVNTFIGMAYMPTSISIERSSELCSM